MALQGADLLLYPTAIGSEPMGEVSTPNTPLMWKRAMQGHAVTNSAYVGAANRIGEEAFENSHCTFYGHSFLCDYRGEIVAEASPDFEGHIAAPLNFAEAQKFRAGMGFFRDRRPDLYKSLLSLDGQ
jgi:N-carbamoylputrescine amidase